MLKEIVLEIDQQKAITKDNVAVGLDGVLYIKVGTLRHVLTDATCAKDSENLRLATDTCYSEALKKLYTMSPCQPH